MNRFHRLVAEAHRDFPCTIEIGGGLEPRSIRQVITAEVDRLQAQLDALETQLADATAGISPTARQAVKLLHAGVPADSVALKVGYSGDNARSSLYKMLKRNGIDVRQLRRSERKTSGQT